MEEQVVFVSEDDWARDGSLKLTTYSTHDSGTGVRTVSTQGWVALKGLSQESMVEITNVLGINGFTIVRSVEEFDVLRKTREVQQKKAWDAQYEAYVNSPQAKAIKRLTDETRPVAVMPTRTTINPCTSAGEYFEAAQSHYILEGIGKRPIDVTSFGGITAWDDAFADGVFVTLRHDQAGYEIGSARIVGIVHSTPREHTYPGEPAHTHTYEGTVANRNYRHYVVK